MFSRVVSIYINHRYSISGSIQFTLIAYTVMQVAKQHSNYLQALPTILSKSVD